MEIKFDLLQFDADLEKLFKKTQPLRGAASEKGTENYSNENNQGELSFGALALTLKWISKAKVDIEKHLRGKNLLMSFK